MENKKFSELTGKLQEKYPDGPYVSRYTIYQHALKDGTIDRETYEAARKFYGRLWNYTGD